MEKLKNDIRELVEKLDYYLYDVTFEKEGADYVLRVMIDNDSFINVDDCVLVSHHVSDFLDETDPISESYNLEVTSPGAERELRNSDEITRAVGKNIYIETVDQKVTGTLVKFKDDVLTIKHKNKKMSTFNYMDVSFIRLAVIL